MAPPREGTREMAPPREGTREMAPPREVNLMMAPPREGTREMAPLQEDDHEDNSLQGDERQTRGRDLGLVAETMDTGTTLQWEEDMNDPFEKALARRGWQITHPRTQGGTIDEEAYALLQTMKKLKLLASGNQEDRKTQQHYSDKDEQQMSRTQQYYIEKQNSTTQQHYPDETQAKTHHHGSDEEEKHDRRTEQQNSRSKHPYEEEEQNSRPQHRYEEKEQQNSRPQHRYEEKEEQNSRPQHRYEEKEEQNSRPQHRYEEKEEQNSRPQHRYEEKEEQNSRPQHRYEEKEEQNSRPQHRYEEKEEQTSRPQHRYEEKEEQNSRPQHRYEEKEEQNSRPQHRYEEEQNSRPQHRYEEKEENSRAQHRYEEKEEQNSRPQLRYEEKEENSRPQHRYEEKEEQNSRPQHRYEEKEEQNSRPQHRYEEKEEQNSRPQHRYEEKEEQNSRAQHRYEEEEEQTSRPQHRYEEKEENSRAQHRYEEEEEQNSRAQHRYDDNVDEQDGRTRQHYPDEGEGKDKKSFMHDDKKQEYRTVTPHYGNEGQNRPWQSYDNEEQGRKAEQNIYDEGEATKPHHHDTECKASRTPHAGQEHQSGSGGGRKHMCVRGGPHWIGGDETHRDSPHAPSWRHPTPRQVNMHDEHKLGWRDNQSRMNEHRPYSSEHYCSHRLQQYNPSNSYSRGKDDGFDTNALNNVYTEYEDKGSVLEAEQLVFVLAQRPSFYAMLRNLFEYQLFPHESVRQVAAAHPHIFHMKGDRVQLQPQVKLCQAHLSAEGWCSDLSCRDLHFCSTYISSWCYEKPCPHGHSLFTQHNKAVLKMFCMERLNVHHLIKLLRHRIAAMTPPSGSIDICQDYNRGRCHKRNCQALHLCLRFVMGRAKCDRPKCDLNHKPLDPACCLLLTAHGISVNETVMDIIVALLNANPSLVTADATKPMPAAQSLPDTRTTPGDTNPKKGSTFFDRVQLKVGVNGDPPKSRESSKSYLQESEDSSSQGSMAQDFSDSRPERDRASGQANSDKAAHGPVGRHSFGSKSDSNEARGDGQTVKAHHRRGNAGISEICRFYVEGKCLKADKGCKRLHASLPFHWQMCESGAQDSWFNLPGAIVTCLELAYCDPVKHGALLPTLDPSQLRNLEKVLHQDTWYANFEAMVLTNSDYSKVVALRRLSIQEGAAPNHAKSRTFGWFFCDAKGKWVKYGQIDSTGKASQKSSVASADIETHYLACPDVHLSFKASQFTYHINFQTMMQTNQTTKVQRAVRRRPEPHPSLHSEHTLKQPARHQPAD